MEFRIFLDRGAYWNFIAINEPARRIFGGAAWDLFPNSRYKSDKKLFNSLSSILLSFSGKALSVEDFVFISR